MALQGTRIRRRQVVAAGIGLVLAGCSSRASTARGGIHYRVEVGDSLAGIARRCGLDIGTICDANRLRDGRLHEGQLLWLPGVSRVEARAERHPASPEPAVVAAPAAPFAGQLRLVSRRDWGARPLRSNHDPMPSINRITVHHTGRIDGMTGSNDVEVVRRIQDMHQNDRNWADIGYHYIVGHDGTVYEGRLEHIQGAHVKGDNNKHNLGISLLGDFMQVMPTRQQMVSLECILGHKRRRLGIAAHRVYGHREFGQTLCPGDRLFAWLERYRRAA